MPLIGRAAVLVFVVATTGLAYAAALLQSSLHGRQPCRRWFAFLVGTMAAAIVFAAWTGAYGLGAAGPGFRGVAFGLFGGTIWGGIFAFANSSVLWLAFDSPIRDEPAGHESVMEMDVGALLSRAVQRLRSFRPTPGFAASGVLPWAIFFAVVLLSMLWAYAFCLLTWLTEGAPGVEPAFPVE